jgi:heat shock protein HslJ
MNKNWLVFCIFLGMMILTACASSGAQQGGDLTGKVWAVTELTGKPLVADTGISAEFTADGKVSGSAGCNRYSGTYTISGSNITFSSPMASTMMMCDQATSWKNASCATSRSTPRADPTSSTSPSTEIQFDLLNLLVDELKEIGVQDVSLTPYGAVLAPSRRRWMG